MRRRLVKKWRIDEVIDRASGARAGVYVDPDTGTFYGHVPEVESGARYTAKTKYELMDVLKGALKDHYALDWRAVILVEYTPAYRWSFAMASATGRSHQWNPEDVSTASDVIGPLKVQRRWIAKSVTGHWRYQDWAKKEIRYAAHDDAFEHSPPNRCVFDYDEALWEALHDFQSRIRELDHRIRHLLIQDDLAPRLIAADRSLLLTENS